MNSNPREARGAPLFCFHISKGAESNSRPKVTSYLVQSPFESGTFSRTERVKRCSAQRSLFYKYEDDFCTRVSRCRAGLSCEIALAVVELAKKFDLPNRTLPYRGQFRFPCAVFPNPCSWASISSLSCHQALFRRGSNPLGALYKYYLTR